MDRGFVGLDIAVLAVGEALAISDEPPAQLVVERLTHAGHRIISHAVVGDNLQQIKAKYLEWIADPSIDVVIVTSGARTESASEALAPLSTKSLLGFAELFRHLTYAEIGTAAMLVDAAAAQCKSTFIFVLPASIGAVRTALDKLLLPQLDYRTKPHNLVMRMSRHHIGAPTDPIIEQTAPVKTPWITAKPGGDTLPPRARTEPGVPAAPSVSVSQRMADVLTNAAPLRSKTPTAVTAVPLKPPASAVPLSALLTNSSERVTDGAPSPVSTVDEPSRNGVVDDESRAADVDRAALARTTAAINAALDAADDRVSPAEEIVDATDQVEEVPVSSPGIAVPPVDPRPPKRVNAPAIPAAARRHTGTIPAFVPPPATVTPRRTSASPVAVAVESGKDSAARTTIAAQKRAVTERVSAVDFEPLDEPPRRIAVPSRRRQRRQRAVIWSVISLAALALLALVLLYFQRQRTPQHGSTPPDAAPIAQQTRPPQPPVLPTKPSVVEPPLEPAIPASALVEPPAPVEPITPPVARPATTPVTRSVTTPTTRPVTRPVVTPPPPAEKPEAPAEAGCDEVSCVLDGFKLACCARFKPKPAEEPVATSTALSKKQVIAGVTRVKPAIIRCGEASTAKGTVKVRVTVQPSGAVKDAVVTDSPEPGLGACVAGVIKKAQFDATDEGGSFSYPFVF